MKIFKVFIAFLSFLPVITLAESREIELNDGTIITGELQSVENGIYTVNSRSMGAVRIKEDEIKAIRNLYVTPTGVANNNEAIAKELNSITESMRQNSQIMYLINTLKESPLVKEILADQKLNTAIKEQNFEVLRQSPLIHQLMQDQTVQQIQSEVKNKPPR